MVFLGFLQQLSKFGYEDYAVQRCVSVSTSLRHVLLHQAGGIKVELNSVDLLGIQTTPRAPIPKGAHQEVELKPY